MQQQPRGWHEDRHRPRQSDDRNGPQHSYWCDDDWGYEPQHSIQHKGEDQSARAPTLPCTPSSSALEYISDLTSRNGLQLDDAARKAWWLFGDRRAYPRKLLLEPHAQDTIPPCYRNAHIDVASRGVDGKSHLYRLKEVTGVDERVQAVVANQEITAHCLLAAMNRIEKEPLQQFSFVCRGATHRSVACCMLLAALAYPNASVHMTTRRTQDAQDAAKALERLNP